MKLRALFLSLTVVSLTTFAPVATSLAQGQSPSPPLTTGPSQANPAVPQVEADRARRLDELYSRLREAPNPRAARFIEREIAIISNRSGSDTADLLHARAMNAMERREADVALSLIDNLIELYPDFTEGLSKRATLHFMRREFGRAMTDLREVLRREPRHFGALASVGMILREMGDDRGAVAAFRRALEINPHMERVPDLVKQMAPGVDGRDI